MRGRSITLVFFCVLGACRSRDRALADDAATTRIEDTRHVVRDRWRLTAPPAFKPTAPEFKTTVLKLENADDEAWFTVAYDMKADLTDPRAETYATMRRKVFFESLPHTVKDGTSERVTSRGFRVLELEATVDAKGYRWSYLHMIVETDDALFEMVATTKKSRATMEAPVFRKIVDSFEDKKVP